MRCNICDKALTDKEVVFNKDLEAYEPCTVCLDAAMDAAYCDGFQYNDEDECVVLAASFDEAETSLFAISQFFVESNDNE